MPFDCFLFYGLNSQIFKIMLKLHVVSKNALNNDLAADKRPCFRNLDSTIPLPPESESPTLLHYFVVLNHGLCRAWSETPKTGFLTTRP